MFHSFVAPPWVDTITVQASQRQYQAFNRLTRSLQVRCDASADTAICFGAPDMASSQPQEWTVVDGKDYSEQVQCPGIWLINRGSAAAVFSVHAVLGPESPKGLPSLSKANGFDATTEPADRPAAVAV